MATNIQEYVTVMQTELDKAAVEGATSGWMELNNKLVRYDGGKYVKIPMLDMDGLADYDRDEGFVDGDIDLEWQQKEFTQDRGRRFTFDEHEVTDTNFIVTASSTAGEFQRRKVIPEIDAYRYSTIGASAITKGKAVGGYTPDAATILKTLYYDIAAVQDVCGDDTPLVITISRMVAAILDMNEALAKTMSVTDFKQGDITLKVSALNGQHPLVRVGSGRMKTKYVFRDGKSTEQKKGGFIPAADAKDINWIICPRSFPIAVSRTDKMRYFDPETYQKKRAWAIDYRKYHDLWTMENQWEAVKVNIKQALS